MNPTLRILACMAVFMPATAATAHHSGAMFDRSRTVTVVGTLKEVQWINPHAWIEVVGSPDAAGPPVHWSFELGGGPGNLKRMGMTRTYPAVGDKVSIKGYPLRDGRPGASFISITGADGHSFVQPLSPLPK